MKKKTPDIKTISFYKYALHIGAVTEKELEDIKVETLLLDSFLFLIQKKIVTNKQKQDMIIFKDKYNQYLEYCLSKKLVKKDVFLQVDQLYISTVPDMSHIQIPDISKELQEYDFDMKNLSKLFSGT